MLEIKEKKLPKPSVAEVEKYLKHWETLENYTRQEAALNKLLTLLPENKEISDVLLKASAINDFYSTNIFAIYSVAELIIGIEDIDKRLVDGDVTLLSEMGKVKIKDKPERSIYSFASKYCSHHNPKAFPIYDSYVDKLLCTLNKEYKFSSFKKVELKDYARFKAILLDFQKYFGLEQFDLKQIDRYLWLKGKEVYPRKLS